MKTLLILLYCGALVLEVVGASTIIADICVRRQRVIAARGRSRQFEMSAPVIGVNLVNRSPSTDELADRVRALEAQADWNTQALLALPSKLQVYWRGGDDEVRNDSMQALDNEVDRLERFVGIADSVRRPLIGVLLVITGTVVGAVGNIVSVFA